MSMLSQRNVSEHRVLNDTKGTSQAGVSSSISTPSENGTPNGASDDLVMIVSTFAHDPPSETTDRLYVTITGPTSLGEATGSTCQVYLGSKGNIGCTHSKDKTQWRIRRQGKPERHSILADDQRFINHVRLESDAMSKAFWIHKAFEYHLNEHPSPYREYRSKCALEAIVTFIQKGVDEILVDISKSVVLIRCDVPFYDSVDLESRGVIEHVVVEYFRSPWLPNWKNRVRSALVQKPRPWFKSVTGQEDEVFPDHPLPNGYIAQSLDASTSPVVANQMPAATVSPSALDDLMEIDMPLSIAAESADTASLQDNAIVYPFYTPFLLDKPSYACQSLDQVCLYVNPADLSLESTSGSNPEVADITYAYDGDDNTDFEPIGNDAGEDDISFIDYTESFPQESVADHPTSWFEAESVHTIIETDSYAVANKKVDHPLPHVTQEHHSNHNHNYNNYNNYNNNNTEEPQQPAAIPEPAGITVANPRPDGRFYCYFKDSSSNDCTKSYVKQGGLDVHIKSLHTPSGRPRCTFFPCTETFSQPSVRTRHENSVHRGHIRVCDNCGMRFARKPSPKDLCTKDPCPLGAGGLHNFILYDPEL